MNRKLAAWFLFFLSLILSLSGLIFVYTGAYFFSLSKGVSPYLYVIKQGIALMIGILLALIVYTRFNYKKIASKKFLWLIYLFANLLLLSVLIFGREINNSKSWIVVGGISFQPAELAKVLVIIFVSGYIQYKYYQIKDNWSYFLGFMFLAFLPVLLILAEGDLGSAMILSIVIFAVLFITGFDTKYILTPVSAGAVLFALAVVTAPYRLARIKMLLDPKEYFQTSGKYSSYQLVQAFVAFAKGGLFGMGIGQGVQSKFLFLTFAFSDFMFAHIAEETGVIGALAVILSFFLFLYFGLSIADRSDELVGRSMALGLTLYIFLQAMVHIGVNLGLLPTTGITLPFMSLGGSSLIGCFLAVGLLMNIARLLPGESKVGVKLDGRGRFA
ncbi:MAG: putative peptidoglycan glycosyltransferase FtsW [Desulfurobacteriaceae bacterium]